MRGANSLESLDSVSSSIQTARALSITQEQLTTGLKFRDLCWESLGFQEFRTFIGFLLNLSRCIKLLYSSQGAA